jgi:hypothetical protein
VGAGTIMAAVSPGPGVGFSIRNPFEMESLPSLNEQLQALMFVLIFVAAASLVVRLYHARGVERQQIKWVAYAGALGEALRFPPTPSSKRSTYDGSKWLDTCLHWLESWASRRPWA